MKFANASNLHRKSGGAQRRDLLLLFCPSDLTAPNRSHYSLLIIPTEAQRRDLLFLFCPSDLTAPNRSHYSPLCHPERRDLRCAPAPAQRFPFR
jgi:hypothetical protein